MENASTEIFLSAHPEFPTRVTDQQTVVLFTKENSDSGKPILVGNIPPFKFTGGTTKQGIT